MKEETATFGMGCFWGVELLFSKIEGVNSATSGYMGGDEIKYPNPTYEQVCSDESGYAEVVEVKYDSSKISYKELLKIFFENHNPTTLNRQGPDFGSQYRSVIFYYSGEQKKMAEKVKKEFQDMIGKEREIVTQIVKASTFFPAEEYHQKYLEKRGVTSCHI
ncbi:MAG: peptide-methionine (S)-S-oxide reductase MsrA [Nanoarchaeota archaeon]|nr:peptide-methionine (S)-S-oxide reductase MsrA [Nanoarchaeota archaeon]